MTIQEEVWWFDNHKTPKTSQWLQSELSEVKNKRRGMLKLIEGDADTFAQRSEMYWIKRPELANMIEDFYQAYHSLAEKYDHLRSLPSGGGCRFFEEWNSTEKSSEVEDPESEQVESRLTGPEKPKKSGGDLAILTNKLGLKVSFKENLSDLFVDVVDPTLEVVYPKSKEAIIMSHLREFPEKMSGGDAIHPLTEQTKHIDNEQSNIEDESSENFEVVHGEPDADLSSKYFQEEAGKSDHLSLFMKEAGTIKTTKAKSTTKASSEHYIDSPKESKSYDPELEEAQDESKLKMSGDDAIHPLTEETKHIDSEVINIADESSEHSQVVHDEPDVENSSKNFLEDAGKSDHLSISIKEVGTIKTNAKSTTEIPSEQYTNPSEESKAKDPELGGTQDQSKLKVVPEKKTDSDVAKLMSQVEKLQEENVAVMAELETKHEDKREVIRHVEKLQEENVAVMAELERKDEEKREVIRQVEKLQEENVAVMAELETKDEDKREVIRQVEKLQEENVAVMAELERKDEEKREVIRQVEKLQEENVAVMAELETKDEDKREVIRQVEKLQEENVAVMAELERKDEEKREVIRQVEKLQEENVAVMAELERKEEEKREVIRQAEKLQEENAAVMAELEKKDEEKREVIRQLSLYMDMLRQENVSMRKFIKEAKSNTCLFPFKNFKCLSKKKVFRNHTKYKTTLVAL